MNASPKVSAVVITKNEEKYIAGCLQSLSWVDEIIVVDSFSTDRTVEICREYTDKVFQRPWPGYAAQKNFGIEQAQNPWILSIDADEEASGELREEILAVLDNPECIEFDGFYIPRKNYLGNRWMRYAGQYPDYQLRLFRESARYITREVHETVDITGPAGYLASPILHNTYENISAFVEKINLYTALEAKERGKQGPPGVFSFIWLPLRKFVWAYFYKKGFLDGILGLIISVSLAYYVFLDLAKTWEAKGALK